MIIIRRIFKRKKCLLLKSTVYNKNHILNVFSQNKKNNEENYQCNAENFHCIAKKHCTHFHSLIFHKYLDILIKTNLQKTH